MKLTFEVPDNKLDLVREFMKRNAIAACLPLTEAGVSVADSVAGTPDALDDIEETLKVVTKALFESEPHTASEKARITKSLPGALGHARDVSSGKVKKRDFFKMLDEVEGEIASDRKNELHS